MLLRETSFDRFIFTCTGCDHAWNVDYDVHHVEDGHGHERDYFFRNQLHCPDPTGLGQTVCPDCGRSAVITHLSSRLASSAIPAGPGGMPARIGHRNPALKVNISPSQGI